MNLYSIDVKIAATLYIKADTPEEAKKIAKRTCKQNSELVFPDHTHLSLGPRIDGGRFSPSMPDVSLSPCMTIHGVWPGKNNEPDLAAEF